LKSKLPSLTILVYFTKLEGQHAFLVIWFNLCCPCLVFLTRFSWGLPRVQLDTLTFSTLICFCPIWKFSFRSNFYSDWKWI